MQNALNPLINLYQTQLEASRKVADAILAGAEKLDRVVLESAHRAVNEQISLAQALTANRDPKNALSLQMNYFLRPEVAAGYQREVMEILAEVQDEIGKSVQAYVQQLGRRPEYTAYTAADARQTQFNPMAGMFSVWENAFKEVTTLANKNMRAARNTFEEAAEQVEEEAEIVEEAVSSRSEGKRK